MENGKGPLAGIRVIDLGRHQAGPRCAQVLARMGAEVIKVERLGGEETRYHSPYVRKQSAYWVQYNSGKKSLSIDLRKEEGTEALRKLVKVSDVLLQNFRPGTIETMGFGYDVLKELNPRIVMVNVSAYGQFGPYREKIGYDPIGQTMSGIAMLTGEDGMPPIRAGVPIIDRTTALHAALGTMAALYAPPADIALVRLSSAYCSWYRRACSSMYPSSNCAKATSASSASSSSSADKSHWYRASHSRRSFNSASLRRYCRNISRITVAI